MKKKGAAYRKMIASFAAIFLMPLCLVSVFYVFSYGVIEKQVEISNSNLAQTIQGACDREVEFYRNTLVQISLKQLLVEKSGDADLWSPKNQSAIQKLVADLQEARTSLTLLSDACFDLFVCFPAADRIVSGKGEGGMRMDTYAKEYFSSDEEKIAAWKEQLSALHKYGVICASGEKAGEGMVFLTYSGKRKAESNAATIGVLLNIDNLTQQVSSDRWGNGYEWLILDADGAILKGAPEDYPVGGVLALETMEKDGAYMVYTAPSAVTDWTYVLLMPKGSIRSSATRIRTFFAVSFLLCVIVAALLIRKAMTLNYRPLEELLRSFQQKEESASYPANEYQFLGSKITELVNAKNSAETTVLKNQSSLARWGLVSLLMKPYQPSPDKDGKVLAAYAQPYAQGEKLVRLLKLRAGETGLVSEEQKTFLIENVFLERMGEIFQAAMTELDGRQVLVLHGSNISGKMKQIVDAVSELQQILWENFQFTVVAACGAVHPGVEGIHRSYLEAQEAEEFIPVLDQDFLDYEKIKDVTCRNYPYSLPVEERISAAVRKDNGQLAAALIGKIIDSNWSSEEFSPRMRRYLLSDIYCTLLKTADEKGCMDQILPLPKDLTTDRPAGEIKDAFAAVVESICPERQSEDDDSDKAFCAKVLAYIRENYSDPSLNISQTAFHFHLSPTALSTIFKNETGKSLLSTINEIRIEKAIELLKQGCTVAETAERVGILESSSFIRLFKKQVGITPGKMKENL